MKKKKMEIFYNIFSFFDKVADFAYKQNLFLEKTLQKNFKFCRSKKRRHM